MKKCFTELLDSIFRSTYPMKGFAEPIRIFIAITVKILAGGSHTKFVIAWAHTNSRYSMAHSKLICGPSIADTKIFSRSDPP